MSIDTRPQNMFAVFLNILHVYNICTLYLLTGSNNVPTPHHHEHFTNIIVMEMKDAKQGLFTQTTKYTVSRSEINK